jgi:hypothetical protein
VYSIIEGKMIMFIINNTRILFTLFICIAFFASVSPAEATENHSFHKFFNLFKHTKHHDNPWGHWGHQHKKQNKHLMLKLAGVGSMYKSSIPGAEEAMCFDIDLIDMRTNEIIGSAKDCMSDVQPKADGLGLTGTTFIHLPEGSLTVQGRISVQPVLEETFLESGQMITHITGSSHTENGIIEGTGIYENRTGNVRLSGMVDMSKFEANEGDLMLFDCLFIIHLD